MRKFGFEIFGTNLYDALSIIGECAEYALTREDMFIELMIVPSLEKDDYLKIKQQLENVEVRLHAPHDAMGFDVGNKEMEAHNKKIIELSQYVADIFAAKTIVVHAACGHEKCNIEETIRQFKLFNDKRIVVENLPQYASNGEALHGNTPQEIASIMQETGCGFCFDFSHAICAALSLGLDIEEQLKGFYSLNPSVYHMCDGDITKAEDLHWHFGKGSYPLEHYLNDYTSENAYITMETGDGIIQHNDLWVKDYNYLSSLIK